MKIEPGDVRDLEPMIKAVVVATLAELASDETRLDGHRLAYREAEAAGLLGIPKHSLRDARLRGEISGSLIGKRIVYSLSDLLEFLRRRKV